MLEEPEQESTPAEPDHHGKEREPDFPPEINAALDKLWDDFNALKSPGPEQADAFVEDLLALPHEATSWNEVFDAVMEGGRTDPFKILHRLAASLAPGRTNNFAFVCWAVVEHLGRLKTPERLPEIARTLLDFNPQSCDPDALSHIGDALLAHGFVNEMIELMSGFLPGMRDNEDVMYWVAPRVAEEIFLLRLGVLISSGDYSSQAFDSMLAGLCAGLDDDICEKSANVPVRYLMKDGEVFSREQFMVPCSTKDSDKQERLWNGIQQAFVEVARDEWQTGNRNPSITLIGLHMIFRSVESWLASPREKGRKYPLNLLDYLNSAAMDRLVPLECGGILGINPERAGIMLDACQTLLRWSVRRGLLAGMDAEKAVKDMARFMKQIGY
jgi:hypothetical protein